MTTQYRDDPNFDTELTMEVEGSGSLPTAEEVKNLQNFIDSEQQRDYADKRVLTRKQKYILGGLLGVLLIIVVSMSAVIAQNNRSAKGNSREKAVVNFLSDNFADRTALTENDSPQKRAAQWIADEDEMNMDIPASSNYEDAYKFVQRYALAVLYFAWGGEDKWIFNYQFLSSKDECEWNYKYQTEDSDEEFELGVKCNKDKEVDYMFMPGNGLDGTLPGELGLLLAMSHLSLFNNNLVGQLPVQMMYLTDLKFMALEQNSLSGEIPDWLAELTHMKFMALGGNRLSGTIPDSLTKMTRLMELSLEENKLEGDISVLNNIPSLTRLFLGNNKFTGEIDRGFLRGLQNLRELDLSTNRFTGILPTHFYNYEILDLHDNDLEGEIPSVEREDHPLMYLLLHNNGFSGRMHNSIARLQHLTRLDVSNNELTGMIPSSFADMDQLQYLYLANNGWDEGPIPSWHNLTGMVELSLKGTNRVGTIPSWLGEELREMELLSLDNNNLTGQIPDTVGHMKRMEYLLLNQNDLTGEVPTTLKHLHALKMLRIDDNAIEGTAEPICANVPPNMDIFTSDCVSSDFQCRCCSNCCDDPNASCNDATYPENDISWKHGYPKNQALFSEDLVFQNIGTRHGR